MFQENTCSSENTLNVPSNFKTVISDFVSDLNNTYPEYSFLWKKWASPSDAELEELYLYAMQTYPERFFDILYQNEDIFNKDSQVSTHFLPNVDFRLLYHCAGISENTRKALWKYLQLVLVTILNGVKDKQSFGDTADLFEGVDEAVLQEKLAETINGISEFFKNIPDEDDSSPPSSTEQKEEFSGINMENMAKDAEKMLDEMMGEGFAQTGETNENDAEEAPSAEKLHEHLKGIFDGKIGNLAKELAEEISGDMKNLFEDEGAGVQTTQDLLKNMVKNPKKIMELMKTVSGKLTQKMKAGDISEEEIMKEASELFGKMKGMGGKKGMGQFGELFKSMAKSMGGSGINMGAIGKMEKKMATKERMINKLKQRQQMRQLSELASQAQMQSSQSAVHLDATSEPNQYVFRIDESEKQEKSTMHVHSKTSPEVDINALANEIENMGASKSTAKTSNKKKGKK